MSIDKYQHCCECRTKRLAFFPHGQFCYSDAPDHQAMLPSRYPEEGLRKNLVLAVLGPIKRPNLQKQICVNVGQLCRSMVHVYVGIKVKYGQLSL